MIGHSYNYLMVNVLSQLTIEDLVSLLFEIFAGEVTGSFEIDQNMAFVEIPGKN